MNVMAAAGLGCWLAMHVLSWAHRLWSGLYGWLRSPLWALRPLRRVAFAAAAQREAQAAVQVDRHASASHRALGFAYYAQGELARATAEAAEALRLAPQSAPNQVLWGLCALEQGEVGTALTAFAKYLELYRDGVYERPQRQQALAYLGKLPSGGADSGLPAAAD